MANSIARIIIAGQVPFDNEASAELWQRSVDAEKGAGGEATSWQEFLLQA